MTTYLCKCGRKVQKSTNAGNTGNRDTAGCMGCPYLMPWGPTVWDDTRHAVVMDIKGYECRMSPSLEYRTELSGNLDDKATLRIAGLDFDFLEKVSAWVKGHYPGGELSGGFSRESIRAAEYVSNGRYRYVLYCVQNKKGIAAKRALWAEFFDETFHRKDMTPEQEKAKVLEDIKRGIAQAQAAEQPASAGMAAAPAAGVCEAETSGGGIKAALPAPFDYSGLGEQTAADLHLAEREYSSGRKLAEVGLRRMADGVAIAHEALCGSCDIMSQLKHGNRGKNTFRAWCESMGLNRKAAERLLQVAKLMDESSPREQKVLKELSPTLLYAAARPSAPAGLVQGVKAGDISTHKQYQELLAEIRTRDAKISELIEAGEASGRRADAAERRAREAEAQCAAMLDKQDEHITRIHALESRPVEVAVQEPDPAEVERMAEEKARAMTAGLRGQLKTAEGNIQRMKSIRDSLQSRLEGWRQAASCQATALTAENVLPMAQDLAGNIRALYNTFLLAAHGLHGEDYRRCAAPLAQALEEALGGLRANTAQYTANRYEEDEDFE